MRRSWPLWSTFALCLIVVLAAMAWISVTARSLDEAEVRSRHQAVLEENVRLALWRIDSALSPILAQESATPYFAYKTLIPIGRPLGETPNQAAVSRGPVSTPFSAATSSYVLVHFQFEPDGQLTSPNVAGGLTPGETRNKTREPLDRLLSLTTRARLRALLPASPSPPPRVETVPPTQSVDSRQAAQNSAEPSRWDRAAKEFALRSQTILQNAAANGQSQLTNNSFSAPVIRDGGDTLRVNDGATANPLGTLPGANISIAPGNLSAANANGLETLPAFTIRGALRSSTVAAGDRFTPPLGSTDLGGVLMTPLWIDGELLLARRITVDGREYVQGCLLDWAAIKTWLLATVSDLLPEADLRPVPGGAAQDESRMLAALPARLVPGPPAWYGPEPPSPIRWVLPVAWGGVLLAAAAVAALLVNVLRLSERRATFVSAVTHELRTPLTTFHMYTEMLSEGMVSDPDQRRQYLDTLRAEASRLSHLVENVLAYARLERRRRNDTEPVAVAQILTAYRERLAGRAAQAGMDLVVEADNDALAAVVRTNPSVVEQILANLVDNACKYACHAENKRLHVTAATCRAGVRITVRDHGPGLPRPVARKLFRPFSKSAQEAAGSAPGIGLGLALSKRLARDMGGRLAHDATTAGGAAFVLTLPLARNNCS